MWNQVFLTAVGILQIQKSYPSEHFVVVVNLPFVVLEEDLFHQMHINSCPKVHKLFPSTEFGGLDLNPYD